MNLLFHFVSRYSLRPGIYNHILVTAELSNASKDIRNFWLMFAYNDDQKKIKGILESHWKISSNEADLILDSITLNKKDQIPTLVSMAGLKAIGNKYIEITTKTDSTWRFILSVPKKKYDYQLKPSDKRWIRLANKLDAKKYAQPIKGDLLNNLGFSDIKERSDLITKINEFFESTST